MSGTPTHRIVFRRRDLRVVVAALLVLAAGCGASAQPTDEPVRNATLSGHEPTADASPVETRAFWDRTSNWEDPRTRNATITSRTRTYHDVGGADAVIVYTTPKKPYVRADRPRSMSPAELAALATRSADVPEVGTDSRPAGPASLLGRNVTVHALSGAGGPAPGHVASTTTTDAVVVVVVIGDVEKRTVERVLGDVTMYGGFDTDG